MLFHTAEFALFLVIVLALFYNAPLSWRRWILLASSYFFYMFWNPWFIPLLLTLTAIDYLAARWIESAPPSRKMAALLVSVCANLGFLGYFKYVNFLTSHVAWIAGLPPDTYHLNVILPLGISFHTFQSISYVVDVYRGEQKAIRSPIDYALFIAFFPQLVAGPIVRACEFFPDLFHWKRPSLDEVRQAVAMIFTGTVKKIVLADQFAMVADAYYANVAATPGTAAAWSATIAFALQIFFDFSGYTDIAIGCAKLFGFHFPVNFRRPYLAVSITDFWRRWHISLSRWLRNYLYIPLGGNRHGRLRTYRNLMLTMLLGGLWHGASWNFVIWGGYHGAWLSIERLLGWNDASRLRSRPIRMLATFAIVCVSWVFFRAATFGDSMTVLHRMFVYEPGAFLLEKRHIAFAAITFILAILEERRGILARLGFAPAWVQAVVFALILVAIEIFGVTDVSIPFVYFQF